MCLKPPSSEALQVTVITNILSLWLASLGDLKALYDSQNVMPNYTFVKKQLLSHKTTEGMKVWADDGHIQEVRDGCRKKTEESRLSDIKLHRKTSSNLQPFTHH